MKFVSLYAGAGGLDLGFVQAGFEPIWSNEYDPYAAETYEGLIGPYFPDHFVRVGDICAQKLPAPRSADLVIGGPPCQGFSVAGRMDPDDPRSLHVWEFLKVVSRVQPSIFVMENVKALATNERWRSLRRRLIGRASRMGYSCEILVLNASHFGVPQGRERMFFIGSRGVDILEPRRRSVSHPPSLRDAFSTIPHFGRPGNSSVCTARVTPARNPVLRRSPFAGMLFNGHGRPLDVDAPAPTLHATMGGNRTPIVDQLQLDEGADPWVVGYHRRLMKGRDPVLRVPRRLRRMTVEEAAAVQTFPAGVDWAGPQSAQFRQIGNAVPPKLAYEVAKAIRRSLEQ